MKKKNKADKTVINSEKPGQYLINMIFILKFQKIEVSLRKNESLQNVFLSNLLSSWYFYLYICPWGV